jgi:tetratricopeptide (TPR) repeat protein
VTIIRIAALAMLGVLASCASTTTAGAPTVGAPKAPAAEAAPATTQLTIAQLLEVAAVLEQSGDTVRAEQYLHAALQQGADERAIVPRLLRLYVADGQYRLAIDQAEHHLRRHPLDRNLRLFVAALHTAVGADALAVAQYERVLRAEPNHAEAHYALAALLHAAGREPGRADEHFRTYLALEPSGHYADEARGLLLTEMP